MEHPKDVGDRSTLAIMCALRLKGFALSLPFGENTRYDLVTDDGAHLSRVQCKSGWLEHGAVRFPTCSSYAHHLHPKVGRRDYSGQIDEFAVFCAELGTVYLVPIADVPTLARASLRVVPTRNGQRKNIRFASDYEIARFRIG